MRASRGGLAATAQRIQPISCHALFTPPTRTHTPRVDSRLSCPPFACRLPTARFSRARAEESVRKQNVKAAKERAEKKAAQDKYEEENPMGHMGEMMKQPKPWEVEEWDAVTESEMMERISRLPMYKTMDAAMLDKIIGMVRQNPKVCSPILCATPALPLRYSPDVLTS